MRYQRVASHFICLSLLASMSASATVTLTMTREVGTPTQVNTSDKAEAGLRLTGESFTNVLTLGGGYTLSCPGSAEIPISRVLPFTNNNPSEPGTFGTVLVPATTPEEHTITGFNNWAPGETRQCTFRYTGRVASAAVNDTGEGADFVFSAGGLQASSRLTTFFNMTKPGGGGGGNVGNCGLDREGEESIELSKVAFRSSDGQRAFDFDLPDAGVIPVQSQACTPSKAGPFCLYWPQVASVGQGALDPARLKSDSTPGQHADLAGMTSALVARGLVAEPGLVVVAAHIDHPHHTLRPGHAPDEYVFPQPTRRDAAGSTAPAQGNFAVTFDIDGTPYQPASWTSFFGQRSNAPGVWLTANQPTTAPPRWLARWMRENLRLRWNGSTPHEWLVIGQYSVEIDDEGVPQASITIQQDIAPFCGGGTQCQ